MVLMRTICVIAARTPSLVVRFLVRAVLLEGLTLVVALVVVVTRARLRVVVALVTVAFVAPRLGLAVGSIT